jgi:hypothetical protein
LRTSELVVEDGLDVVAVRVEDIGRVVAGAIVPAQPRRARCPFLRPERPGERDLILSDLGSVEPMLRATCTHEIDASRPLDDVVDALIAIGQDIAS